MCSTHEGDHLPEDRRAALRAEWQNLRQPGPFGWKLRRLLVNTGIKVVRRQRCCGHDGEPGC